MNLFHLPPRPCRSATEEFHQPNAIKRGLALQFHLLRCKSYISFIITLSYNGSAVLVTLAGNYFATFTETWLLLLGRPFYGDDDCGARSR